MALEPELATRAAGIQRLLESKARWHRAQVCLPLKEKVRILIELQRQDLPLIARQRPLRSWEKPWPIKP